MDGDVLLLVKDLEVTEPATTRGLQVFGLRHAAGEAIPYTVLDEAIEADMVDVTEVNEVGAVSRLKIVNKSDSRVFIMAGEMLLGAKQNRVVNASMMVDGHSEMLVPVTCIERGRWGYRSRKFRGSGTSSHGRLRRSMSHDALRALKRRQGPVASQSSAWDMCAHMLEQVGSFSPTGSLHQVYEDRKQELDDSYGSMKLPDDCSGVAFAVDGRMAGVDLFDRPETLRKLFPKLLRSHALDAMVADGGAEPIDQTCVKAWLDWVGDAKSERFKSPGLGEDVRIEGTGGIGACLVVDHHPVHAELFPSEELEF